MAIESFELEPIKRLTRDLKRAAVTLSPKEARYLVDIYYQVQEYRKRAANQVSAMNEEPHEVIAWAFGNFETLENQIKRALDAYTDSESMGRWSKAVHGIGPVLSAGLLAHIEIEKAPTVGHIWRFAGLDPSMVWEKSQKRPWNARLKVVCVHPDAYVTTRRGPVPISDVRIGDEVTTHLGRWRPVAQVFMNHHEGDLYGLRSANAGNQVAWLTAGHPVYVAPVDVWASGRTRKPNEITRRPFGWYPVEAVAERWNLSRPVLTERIPASPLVLVGVEDGETIVAAGRWDGVPAPRGVRVQREVTIDTDFMRLAGLFIAEGHISRSRVVWSFNAQEADLIAFVCTMIRRLTDAEPWVSDVRQNATQVSVGCKPLADAFAALLGTNGMSMRIPGDWLAYDDDLACALWQGILEGDGDHVGPTAGRRISLRNAALARQVVDLGRRLGLSVSLHTEPGERAHRIHVNKRNDQTPSARSLLCKPYIGPVYNLEVEEDHSYIVEGYAVHNCWKIGESFVKVSNSPKDFYGHLYRQRKELEQQNNDAGLYADQAADKLKKYKIGKDTDAYAYYIKGMLPPAHINERAKRWAVKLFLAHWHAEAYRQHYGAEPPKPYPLAILGHGHEIKPPA